MAATPLEVKKANRALFMSRLYDITDGHTLTAVDHDVLVAGMQLSEDQEQELVDYLLREALIEILGMGSPIPVTITHRGVVEVEQSMEQPELATEHFPPAATVLTIHGNVVGSNIAQASPHASQTLTYTAEQRQELTEALEQVRALLDVGLPSLDHEQILRSDVQTIEAQLTSPRPNAVIVRTALSSVVGVLTVLTGDSELAQAALEAVKPFLGA